MAMGLTDYRALLIDCDEVLIDRDAGVWAGLQPLLEQGSRASEKEQTLGQYKDVVRTLYPRFDELGFSGLLCFAYRQLAEQLGIKATWEEGMSFARSAPNWTLYEDAPGAMLYLRKFYQVRVYVHRDLEDRDPLCQRLGLAPEHLVSLAGDAMAQIDWLAALDIAPAQTLLLSRPPAQPLPAGGLCLIRRGRAEHAGPCLADFCINSMADLVSQHQLSLRR